MSLRFIFCVFELKKGIHVMRICDELKKIYMRKQFYKVFGLSKINIQKLLKSVKGFYFYIIFSFFFNK